MDGCDLKAEGTLYRGRKGPNGRTAGRKGVSGGKMCSIV